MATKPSRIAPHASSNAAHSMGAGTARRLMRHIGLGEGLPQHLEHVGRREQTADEHDHDQVPASLRQRRLQQQPLADEAATRWQSHEAHSGQGESEGA